MGPGPPENFILRLCHPSVIHLACYYGLGLVLQKIHSSWRKTKTPHQHMKRRELSHVGWPSCFPPEPPRPAALAVVRRAVCPAATASHMWLLGARHVVSVTGGLDF